MDFLGVVASLLSLPLSLAGFAWYAVRARRSGGGQSLVSPFQEIWDPVAHRTSIEIRAEAERTPQTPSPGDPPLLLPRCPDEPTDQ
ncbi:hypothetical protein ACFFSW_25630 [Saccharothrix longispora]|uniref:Secreted protein n=1 Tax=Saccharothrix longispora TaxID=33920 RepID=A0ABU1PPE3_9PSEU|nr:hypothetical protein [Saccharothrix longispora]MDR6592503.1 hypothetical protein [Saccharothrix longispora]